MNTNLMDGLQKAGRIARLMLALILMGIAAEGTIFSATTAIASGPQCVVEKTDTTCLTWDDDEQANSSCHTPTMCATCEFATSETCTSEPNGSLFDHREI